MEWLFYGLALLLTLLWFVATWWMLLRDRAKGRSRCPRCFYELTDPIPERCPECGRAWKSLDRLGKTRRRWKRFMLASSVLLIGAAGSGGMGYTRNHDGWKLVPDAVLTRMLFLGIGEVDNRIQRRIYSEGFDRADSLRIVRFARRRLTASDAGEVKRGIDLLWLIAANESFASKADVVGRHPQLEELDPERTVSALLALYDNPGSTTSERTRIHLLLTFLRDVDQRVNVRFVRDLASDDIDLQISAISTFFIEHDSSQTVKRLPRNPHNMPSTTRLKSNLEQGLPIEPGVKALAELADRLEPTFEEGRPTAATIGILRLLATKPVDLPPANPNSRMDFYRRQLNPEFLIQRVSLWLWCRFDEFSPECWEAVESIAIKSAPVDLSRIVRLVAGFEYSPTVEDFLRTTLLDSSGHPVKVLYTLETIASYGTEASGFIPDVLELAADPHRLKHGGISLIDQFSAIGGDPNDLLHPMIDRVYAYLEAERSGEIVDDEEYRKFVHPLAGYFFLIMYLEQHDTEAAARVLPLLDSEHPGIVMYSALAYAQLSGETTLATRAILSFEPEFKMASRDRSSDHVYKMFSLGLYDISLIEQYVFDPLHPERPADFVNLVWGFIPANTPDLFPLLQRIAEGNDADAAQKAQAILDFAQK